MIDVEQLYIANLVKRAQKEDSEAFAKLYAITYRAQYAFAKKYLHDGCLAQDAVQEVYIRALNYIGRLKEPGCFNSWLCQINFRVCYDMAVKNRCFCGEIMDIDTVSVTDEAVSSNPEALLLWRADREDLRQALESLPLKERNAVVLKYIAELSLADIARTMRCSISSVSRYLSRGQQKLRQKLGAEGSYNRTQRQTGRGGGAC